jgi:hypothetical protein
MELKLIIAKYLRSGRVIKSCLHFKRVSKKMIWTKVKMNLKMVGLKSLKNRINT